MAKTKLSNGGTWQPNTVSNVSAARTRTGTHASTAILANRYCGEAGALSSTRPLSAAGWPDSISNKPVKLTNPRASPLPTAMEKSPCVTKPRRTLEQ